MKTMPMNIQVRVPFKVLRGRSKKPERILVRAPFDGEIKLIESLEQAPIALRARTVAGPRSDEYERRVVEIDGKEALVRPVMRRHWENIRATLADARAMLTDGYDASLKIRAPLYLDSTGRDVFDVLPLDTRVVLEDHTEAAMNLARETMDRVVGIEGTLFLKAAPPAFDLYLPSKTGGERGRFNVSDQVDLAPGYLSHGFAFMLDRVDDAVAFARRHGLNDIPPEFSSFRIERPDLLGSGETIANAYMGVRTIEFELQEALADLSAAGLEQLGRLLTQREKMVAENGGDAVWAIIDELDDAVANRFHTPALAPRIFERIAKVADMTKDALSMSRDLPPRPVIEFGDDPELANLGL
mgnify:CR=1 FL=1